MKKIGCYLISIILLFTITVSSLAENTVISQPDKQLFMKNDGEGETPPEKPGEDGETPPEKPGEEGETPPEKPGEEGETPPEKPGEEGGSFGGGSSAPSTYSAVKTYSEDTALSNTTVESTGKDESAVWVSAGKVTMDQMSITQTSQNSTGGDNSSFYGVGAAVLATGGQLTVSDSTIATNAAGGAGVFAYGNSVVTVNDTIITTQKDTSGGIHVAGGGTLYANDVTVTTQGNSSAAIRSDRGGGTMVVNGGSFTSNGNGSPAVYVTADITASNADLKATGSEAICIEGKNSLTLKECSLSGNMKDDSQNEVTWTVILYQSMSGDSEIGCSVFDMEGGKLTSSNGGLFYTTNTKSKFILNNVSITAAKDHEFFLRVTGNTNQRGWGSSGSNGSECTFTAINQTMNGDVQWDSISTLDLSLTKGSVLTGAIVDDESCAGKGGTGYCNVSIDANSKWIVTGNSTVSKLENQGKISDTDGNTVTIMDADGNTVSKGTSPYSITVLTAESQTIAVSSIKLSAEQMSVQYVEGNTSITVASEILPENADNKALSWSVSDDDIATISAGIVNFKQAGTVTVTAAAMDGSGVSSEITLTAFSQSVPVALIKLSVDQVSVQYVEGSTNITVASEILPENADNKALSWSVSDDDIATISAGIVNFKQAGTVTVTAAAMDGSGVSSEITLTAFSQSVPVASIKLSVENRTVPYVKGKTNIIVTAAVSPADATDPDVIWSSSDKTVAVINSYGKVTFKKAGTVKITCVANDGSKVSKSIKLTAYLRVTGFKLYRAGSSTALKLVKSKNKTKTALTITKGKSIKLIADQFEPSGVTNKNLIWKSLNTTAATVKKGVIKGVSKGTAIIQVNPENNAELVYYFKVIVK